MMKSRPLRTILIGMLFTFLCIAVSMQASDQAFAEDAQSAEPAERTVMLYLCGSDLEPIMGTHNLQQILQSKFSSDGKVRFIVMTGGAKRWMLGSEHLWDPNKHEVISSISRKYNQIWEAKGLDAPNDEEKGKLVLLDGDGISGDGDAAKQSKDELMSDPDTLKAFINFCAGEFPAKKYDLILWDHGDGPVGGFAVDKHDDNEAMMSFPQIVDALSDNAVIKRDDKGKITERFDMVDFDACLMNSVELNLALSDLTDYYVAAAAPEPGFGQDYRGWLNAVGADPTMNTFEIGKIIVDDFAAYYNEGGPGFGQDGTLAVIDMKKLLDSGFVEALNAMDALLKRAVTEPDADTDNYFYYDELSSSEGAIQYSPGRETYRDLGNLAGMLCVPLREFANDYVSTSHTICQVLGNEEIVYGRSTAGVVGDVKFFRNRLGWLKYEKLLPSGMYLFFPILLGTAETAEYCRSVRGVWELMNDREIGSDSCRAFLESYPDTALHYAFLVETGKAVSALVEEGIPKADIDYSQVAQYWMRTYIPVTDPLGMPTGETINFWTKTIKPLIDNYEGGEGLLPGWLNPLIRHQAADAVSKANISATKVTGTDHDGYKVSISDTDKRIVDRVDTLEVVEIPDAVGVDPKETKFVLHTIPGSVDLSDLDPLDLEEPNSFIEALRTWFEKNDVNWNVEKQAAQCYAIEDAEGKKHAAQVVFEPNGTASVVLSYTVMEPVDPQENVDGSDDAQQSDELKPVSKLGKLIFERGDGNTYTLSQFIPEVSVSQRPVAIRDMEAEMTKASAIYTLNTEGMKAYVRINKEPFVITRDNAGSIRLVLTDFDQIPDIGDVDGDGIAVHEEYVVKDMFHHEFDITDIIREAKEEPVPDDGGDAEPTDGGGGDPQPAQAESIQGAKIVLSSAEYTYNGKVQKPDIQTIGDKALKEGTDFTAEWSNANSKNAGTYIVRVTGKGNYTGMTEAAYTIHKAANTLSVKGKKPSVKYKKLKIKAQTLKTTKVFRFKHRGQGPKSYKLVSAKKGKKNFRKKFKINAKSGKVTVKKGLKKGTYKLIIKVKAKGGKNYRQSKWKKVTVRVKVK